ncbi:MAG: hypothetical protein ACKVVP_12630 [Chloroflexota bacterium]
MLEQWIFATAAFGVTGITIMSYILILRSRSRAAELELELELVHSFRSSPDQGSESRGSEVSTTASPASMPRQA